MATGDLTTRANAKAWLGVSQDADDKLLDRLITAISTNVQSWMNRNIALTGYVETRNGTGTATMLLRNAPVVAVTALAIAGVAVLPAASYTGTGYRVAGRKLILTTAVFPRGDANVTVSYTAGFATVPADLEQAVLELVALRYKERDRIGFASKTLAGETVSFITKDMTESVRTLLMQYRDVVPI